MYRPGGSGGRVVGDTDPGVGGEWGKVTGDTSPAILLPQTIGWGLLEGRILSSSAVDHT